MMIASDAHHHLRTLVLRIYLEEERIPPRKAPLEIFSETHLETTFVALFTTHSFIAPRSMAISRCRPSEGHTELTNGGTKAIPDLYFQVDYEQYADVSMVGIVEDSVRGGGTG